ncbi:MAG: helix-hairpin-helix domain-containing protein [Caldilineaceae bacterium]
MIADVLARMGDERTMQEMVGRDVVKQAQAGRSSGALAAGSGGVSTSSSVDRSESGVDDSARHGPESRRAVTMQSTPVYTHPPSKGHNMPSPQKELVRNLPRGVSQPARRALASAGYTDIEELAQATEAELLKLHGMGPKAIGLIRDELEARGLSFKE